MPRVCVGVCVCMCVCPTLHPATPHPAYWKRCLQSPLCSWILSDVCFFPGAFLSQSSTVHGARAAFTRSVLFLQACRHREPGWEINESVYGAHNVAGQTSRSAKRCCFRNGRLFTAVPSGHSGGTAARAEPPPDSAPMW